MPLSALRRLFAHPLTAGLNLDDPATTRLRREILSSKGLLRAIYDEWYGMLARELPKGEGAVLELGSGAGYCQRYIPNLITSETFFCPEVRMIADAQRMPIKSNSLRAIVFTNVLHHIPDVRRFLREASRCVHSGGRILMIEPWVTPWSQLIYTKLHHEPFCPAAVEWAFSSAGPLSSANGALPWIVFVRDRKEFQKEFPEFEIVRIEPLMPFRYLLSGGLGMRSLMPGFVNPILSGLERALRPCMSSLGMFAFISVKKM